MKIKCLDCVNELNKKCLVKKTTIKLTKDRKCNYYDFDYKREVNRLDNKIRVADKRDRDLAAKRESVSSLTNPDVLQRFRTNASE